SKKPVVDIPVLGVSKIVVSADPNEGVMIRLETEAETDLRLIVSPAVLAQLEIILVRGAQAQANHQPRQRSLTHSFQHSVARLCDAGRQNGRNPLIPLARPTRFERVTFAFGGQRSRRFL